MRTKLKHVKSQGNNAGMVVLIIGVLLGILFGSIVFINLNSTELFLSLFFVLLGVVGKIIALILILVGLIILANIAYQKDQTDKKRESKAEDKSQNSKSSSTENTDSRE